MDTVWFDSDDPAGEGWHVKLDGLRASYRATRVDEVEGVLSQADGAVRDGRWAAVAVAYEAAPAFDPAMRVVRRSVADPPLAWVGIYDRGHQERSESLRRAGRSDRAATFASSVGVYEFSARVRDAQEHILAGDTYQVNLTFPMCATGVTNPDEWYQDLRDAQQARYCARLDVGSHLILSLSPELFFERRGERLITRPMKGTAARGRWLAEDEEQARALVASGKERAENVMIADLLRNDIGRVARVGTVRVPELFRLERYPTVWQMTSTVEGQVPAGTPLATLFKALFPCGSVTGAPKIRAMEIVAALEQRPRGLYTGAVGYVRPDGDCTFNVAIRTIVIDRETGAATMGVGAGITADSAPRHEYDECLVKAAFTNLKREASPSSFLLLETMRLEDGDVTHLNRHLARMAGSARHFGFAWNDSSVRHAVENARTSHGDGCWRLRLVVDRHGVPNVTCTTHEPGESRPWRVAYAESPVDDRDQFLFNKTTHRAVYDAARNARPNVDDVLLWNRRGEVTESTIANLVAELDGVRVTPPANCGLLPGVCRAAMIDAGGLTERVLSRDDLARASRLWLINSLRGWVEATLVP